MSWEIALGIFALFAFVSSVTALAVKLTRPITELSGEIKLLRQSIEELRQTTQKDIGHIENQLDDHEKRLRRGGL